MCIKKVKKCLFGKAPALYQEIAELTLRLVLGAFMLTHGSRKFFSFAEKYETFPDPLGIGSCTSLILATFAEFFCSILVILGLFTRFASLSILTTMLTAGLIFHYADPFSKKELALLYAIGFFYFTIAGSNRYSLDYLLFRKNK